MKFRINIKIMLVALTIFTGLGVSWTFAEPGKSTEERGEPGVFGTRVVDLDGRVRRLGEEKGPRPLVLVFMAVHCPISRRYTPALNELARSARSRGVEFYGVFSDPMGNRKEIREFRKSYGLKFPLLFDASGDLARRMKPIATPESYLFNQAGKLVYRGRIDDRFAKVGVLRRKIGNHDLRDAVRATLKGKLPRRARTKAIGCLFEAWNDKSTPEQVTYSRDIEPLIRANCVECHTKGGIAPFPLTNYKEVKRRARMVGYTVSEGFMPPWRGKPGYGHFRDQRILSRGQIELINKWVRTGKTFGKRNELLPPLPRKKSGWRLGKPDLVLTMPKSFSLPAKGDDIYRYFVIPSGMTKGRILKAVDFRPGDPTVVHHCNFFVDYAGRAREMDRKSPGVGFSVFGKGSFMEYDGAGSLGAWAPGGDPYKLPEGLGISLPAGGDIVMEIHYHLSGKATRDRSSIALYFEDKPVKNYVDGLFLGTQDVNIPAGQSRYNRRIWMDVPVDMTLIDIAPHMHYLGKEVQRK